MASRFNKDQIIELLSTYILTRIYRNCYDQAFRYVEIQPSINFSDAYATYLKAYYRTNTTSEGYRAQLNNILLYFKANGQASSINYSTCKEVNHDIKCILLPKGKMSSEEEELLVRKFLLASLSEIIKHIISTKLYIEIIQNYHKKQISKKLGEKCKQIIKSLLITQRDAIYHKSVSSESSKKVTMRNLQIKITAMQDYIEKCHTIIRRKNEEAIKTKKMLEIAMKKAEHYRNESRKSRVELPPSMPITYGMTGAGVQAPMPLPMPPTVPLKPSFTDTTNEFEEELLTRINKDLASQAGSEDSEDVSEESDDSSDQLEALLTSDMGSEAGLGDIKTDYSMDDSLFGDTDEKITKLLS